MFPARAGMNRSFDTSSLCIRHVPRPCGDEPYISKSSDKRVKCSPPVRG